MYGSVDGGASSLQWSATYDGSGIRASQTDSSGTRVFHTDGDTLLQETGGTAPTVTHTPGLGQRSGSTDRTFHQDWLGSSRYLTDNAGTTQSAGAWSAYGKRAGSSGSVNDTRLRWGGGWGYQSEAEGATNETELVLMGQRYYDPEVARFISPDPSGFSDGLNLYSYVGGDPVGAVDPTGLWAHIAGGAAGNVAVGFVVAKLTGQEYGWGDVAAWGAATASGAGLFARGAQWLAKSRFPAPTLRIFGKGNSFDAGKFHNGTRVWATRLDRSELGPGALKIGGTLKMQGSLWKPRTWKITKMNLEESFQVPAQHAAKMRPAFSSNLFAMGKGLSGQYSYQAPGWAFRRMQFIEGASMSASTRSLWEGGWALSRVGCD